MERNFVLLVCVALFSNITVEPADLVNTNPKQDVLWTETNVTMIECMAACFQRNKCFSVQFSQNGTCLGLRGKFVKSSTLRDDSQIGYSYVSDKGKTSEKMKSLAKQTASSRPKIKGKTSDKTASLARRTTSQTQTKRKTSEKMKSLAKQKASSRPKPKGKTSDKTVSLARRRTSQTQTKNSHKPCVAPPRHPNADMKYITENGSVETVKYSCKPGFISCSKTMTRSCLPTGKWDTDIVKCVKNTWTGPFGPFDYGQPRFFGEIPCGPQTELSISIQGGLFGRRMEILLMEKKDILFDMYYDSSMAVFGAILNGKKKMMLKRKWSFGVNTPFILKIDFFGGQYWVFLNDYLKNKIVEPKPGAMPSCLVIQHDVKLMSVTINR